MDILRCGVEAALVELDDRDQVLALHASLRASPPDGMLELVPAARTLLVRFDRRRTGFARIAESIAAVPPVAADDHASVEVLIPVRYDGADLTEVASATGLTRAEVIRRHTAARYRVAFCGFAPGFAYITGLDPALHLPRRATPRTAVPPGSVALADEYTGVYPRSSPGGWRLIGTSELSVWDLERDPPTVLTPGCLVRFEAVGS